MASAAAAAPFTPAPVPGGEGTPPQAVLPKPVIPKKEVPATPNKVVGAKILLQYKGEDGKMYEAVTTIDPEEVKVQAYSLAVEEKHEKKYIKQEDGTKDLAGFEDTGERVLTFKLRYHVR
jgi:hypothetical protein